MRGLTGRLRPRFQYSDTRSAFARCSGEHPVQIGSHVPLFQVATNLLRILANVPVVEHAASTPGAAGAAKRRILAEGRAPWASALGFQGLPGHSLGVRESSGIRPLPLIAACPAASSPAESPGDPGPQSCRVHHRALTGYDQE